MGTSTVLLTGASGFIGSRLRIVLTQRGLDVVATSRRPLDECIPCDIRNMQAVETLIEETCPDIVIHCAAISGVDAGNSQDYHDVNVVGTGNLVNALCKSGRCTRFLFLSTAGVYGNQVVETLKEDMKAAPIHHYGRSKLAAEDVVLRRSDRMQVTILRPFNIIGPGQSERFIVSKLVSAFVQRHEVVKLGNMNVYRDFVDVRKAVEVMADLVDCSAAGGKILNICTGRGTSLQEIIVMLQGITGHRPRIEQAAEHVRTDELWRLVGCTSQLRSVLRSGADELPMLDILHDMLNHQTAQRELA